MAGRFTTVEGILDAMKDQLVNQGAIFRDSEDVETKERMDRYVIFVNFPDTDSN